jgi:site-specific recombinase XerD
MERRGSQREHRDATGKTHALGDEDRAHIREAQERQGGRHFKPLLERAGLPAIRLHDLRHTCATILLMVGKHPKYVQGFLGNARISITLDTYSHVIEGMDGGLADAMDEAL